MDQRHLGVACGPVGRTLEALFFSVALLFVLSGCAIKLAPSYDKSIIEGLTAANEKALVFFASVADGTSGASYSKREETYADLIGKFEAIGVQAKSRPYPRSQLEQLLGSGPSIGISTEEIRLLDQAPTVYAIEKIVVVFSDMRKFDKTGRLSKLIVEGQKNRYEISITQAFVYERALER